MRFAYKGSDADGQPVHGETSAESPEEATEFLQEQGIEVTELKKVGQRKLRIPGGGVDRSDVATFCQQLANLTESGLPLPQALESVSRDASSGRLRDALERFAEGVKQGKDLSEMLEQEKAGFPPILTALVSAGEKTGNLSEALRLAGTHLWRLKDLRDHVRNAVLYPVLVFVLLCIIGSIVFLQVVPEVQGMVQAMEVEFGWKTRVVFAIADSFPAIAGGVLGLGALLYVTFCWVNRPAFWVRMRRWILFRVPLFGRVLRSAFLCRFSRLASMLLKSGCSTPETLDLLAELEKQRLTHAGGKAMAQAVRKGKSIGEAMRARLDVFPELLVWMVESGESSGQLSRSFAEAADIYRQETERNIEVINSTLPGVSLMVVGAALFGTIYLLFAPFIALLGELS